MLASCNQGLSPCVVGCGTHYLCRNQTRCVARITICDGKDVMGCAEEDEYDGGPGFQCIRNGYCRIPQQLLWDGIRDCDQGEDLCFSNSALSIQNTTR